MESPRIQALGGAGSALEHDPAVIWTNPAAAARLTGPSVALGGHTTMFGGTTAEAVGMLPLTGGVASVGVAYDGGPPVTLNGSDGTSRTVTSGREVIGMAGYSMLIGSNLAAGFMAKVVRSELAEDVHSNGMMLDVGVQCRLGTYLKVGAGFRNMGSTMRYLEDGASAPGQLHAGLAAAAPLNRLGGILNRPNDYVVAVCDADYRMPEGRPVLHGGAEYWWNGAVILRAGSRLAQARGAGNVAMGIGIRLNRPGHTSGQYRFDYSLRLLTAGFQTPHNAGLTVIF